MDLDKFNPFFEIVGSLCFLYAGSETFRAAISETILQLNTRLDKIRKELVEGHQFLMPLVSL